MPHYLCYGRICGFAFLVATLDRFECRHSGAVVAHWIRNRTVPGSSPILDT